MMKRVAELNCLQAGQMLKRSSDTQKQIRQAQSFQLSLPKAGDFSIEPSLRYAASSACATTNGVAEASSVTQTLTNQEPATINNPLTQVRP